ncbi:hypothetical protein D3C72_688640 [compost metagenome]
MVVSETVDLPKEAAEGLGVAIRQVGVAEDAAEQLGQVRVLDHLGQSLGIHIQHFLAADPGCDELGPAIAFELAGEELTVEAELLRLEVHVIHELVDEGDSDLFDLALRVGDFTDKDVAAGVDAAFGI